VSILSPFVPFDWKWIGPRSDDSLGALDGRARDPLEVCAAWREILGAISFARMGDHVAVDVGELVASRVGEAAGLVSGDKEETEALIGMVECRICQEEDLTKNLESPCACSGSLKVRAALFLFIPTRNSGSIPCCLYCLPLVHSIVNS
jgi:hypothetical protein